MTAAVIHGFILGTFAGIPIYLVRMIASGTTGVSTGLRECVWALLQLTAISILALAVGVIV